MPGGWNGRRSTGGRLIPRGKATTIWDFKRWVYKEQHGDARHQEATLIYFIGFRGDARSDTRTSANHAFGIASDPFLLLYYTQAPLSFCSDEFLEEASVSSHLAIDVR